jgi:arylsulfatase A-like enzyme
MRPRIDGGPAAEDFAGAAVKSGSVAPSSAPVSPVVLVAWFALCAAGLELAYMAGFKLQQHVIFASLQILWMTPLAYLILFSPLLVLILVLRRVRPSVRWFGLSIVLLAAMTTFSFLSLFWGRLGPISVLILTAGVTTQGARSLLARREGLARLARRTLPWMVGFALLAGVGLNTWSWLRESSGLRSVARRQGTPNVILLVLDTVRAMSMSLYGYPRQTTPALTRFAATGVVFEEAYSTAPWTLPSIATMFTGQYPHEHGADWTTPLSKHGQTLAEHFRDAGYATAGFVANLNYSSAEVGLGRGFLHFEDYTTSLSDILLSASPGRFVLNNPALRRAIRFYDTFGRKSADELNSRFLAWLDDHAQRPFFAYLNYYDAHQPYLPPRPFDTLFGPDTLRNKGLIRHIRTRDAHRIDKEAMTAEERAAEQQAYDGAIAYLDSRLEQLIAELDRRALSGNTIVIITGDHGELFGEHSLFDHGNSLYLPLLHVPLVLRAPNLAGGVRIATPVTLRDLPRTILDLADLEGGTIPGASFAGLANGAGVSATGSPLLASITPAKNIPASDPVFRGPMWTFVSPPHQYILGGDGAVELYDSVRDPAQLVNLATDTTVRSVRDRLRAVLDSLRRK